MKKIIGLVLIVGIAAIAYTSCQSVSSPSSTTTKTLSDSAAQAYAEMGVNLQQDISGWMVSCAKGGVNPLSIKGLKATAVSTSDVTNEGNGWYHVTSITTDTVSGADYTYSMDMHIKVGGNASSMAAAVEIYGSYGLIYSDAGSHFSLSQTYGSQANPFKGTMVYAGSSLSQMTISGSITYNITIGDASETNTVAMTFTFDSFALDLAVGYPTGKIIMAIKYNNDNQPPATITFNKTAAASFSYDIYTSTLAIEQVKI